MNAPTGVPSHFLVLRLVGHRFAKTLYKVFETDLSKGYPNYPQLISSDIANPIFKGEKSVVQALDSVKSKLQDILDQYN